MSIDAAVVERLEREVASYDPDHCTILGVPVELPLSRALGASRRHRGWQRRVLDGIMPNSPNADAPERMPFRILYALTEGIKTEKLMEEVLADDLSPLAPLYQVTTRGESRIPVAFHVLAVKAASKGQTDSKGFKEETFLLLCRHRDGSLNTDLIARLIAKFRQPFANLDLAQRTLLSKLAPGWTPDQSPRLYIPDSVAEEDVPYDPVASELFQADLETLLEADMPPADFFHSLNLVLSLHVGLYQPRLAGRLNREMAVLEREFGSPSPDNLAEMERLVALGESRVNHPFRSSLPLRAPPAGEMRPVPHKDPVRVRFDDLERDLAHLHFSLLTLNRLRELAISWLRHHGDFDRSTAQSLCRTPLQIIRRMRDDQGFSQFMRDASVVLAARFIHDQLGEQRHHQAWAVLRGATGGVAALREFYQYFDRDKARNKTSTRAHRQGIAMAISLLRQSDYGIIQTRRGLGSFFELGGGLLPLLLLLTIGHEAQKLQVDVFWERLGDYGFSFDAGERDRLLGRLKDMGLYERFSDAGAANYVRNLLTIRDQGHA
jgi:hypothetical protein